MAWDWTFASCPDFFQSCEGSERQKRANSQVQALKNIAAVDPGNKKYSKEIKKYLNVIQTSMNPPKYTVEIRKDIIQAELRTAGWLVMVSNYEDNPQKAIQVYRNKDYVEKGFDRLKNSFDYHCLRVHNDERTENKLLCGFIATILGCALDKAMRDADLYSTYTMEEMFIKAAQIRMATVYGQKIYRPLTKKQKDIFRKLDVPLP